MLALVVIAFIGGQVTAFSINPEVRISLLDVSVVCWLLFSAWKSRGTRYIPPLWLPILLFALCTFLSGGSLAYTIRWLLYAALYWTTIDVRILIASGIGISIFGFLQYFLYPDLRNLYYLGWDPHYQRLFSTLLDPNFAGIILALTALLLLVRKQFILFLLPFFALLLTYSRSSYLGFSVGLLFINKKIAMMVGIAALVVFVLLPKGGEGRNVFRTVSSFARIDSAHFAVQRMMEKPLFGHGFRQNAGIDTSLLFVGESTGLVGLSVYMWLLFCLWRLKTFRPFFAALFVHSLFVHSLFYPWVMVWMWAMAGMSPSALLSLRSLPGRAK